MQDSPERRRSIRIFRRLLLFAYEFLADVGATLYALPDHSAFYRALRTPAATADALLSQEEPLSQAELREWHGIVTELRRGSDDAPP
jgi:hypothetical protein